MRVLGTGKGNVGVMVIVTLTVVGKVMGIKAVVVVKMVIEMKW